MLFNNLMARLQAWRFGEYGVPLHCHCSQVPLCPGVEAPDRVLSMGQIEQTAYKQMTDVKF